MRCLYCGKELALLKRWTGGGEFCSDAHRLRYQEEYNQLALNRLLQAHPPSKSDEPAKEADTKPGKPLIAVESAPEAAAYKKPPSSPPTQSHNNGPNNGRLSAPLPKPDSMKIPEGARTKPSHHEPPAVRETPVETARPIKPLPIEEPVPAQAAQPEQPAPAEAAGFLVEMPAAALAEVAPLSQPDLEFLAAVAAALPNRVFETLASGRDTYQLDTAGLLTFEPHKRVSNYTASGSRERKLEVRDFVRTAPVVEIDLSPAGETGLETTSEAMDILIFPQPPQGLPVLWLEPPLGFLEGGTELGALARLSFSTTGFSSEEQAGEEPSSGTDSDHAVALAEHPAPVVIPENPPAAEVVQEAVVDAVAPAPEPLTEIGGEPEAVPAVEVAAEPAAKPMALPEVVTKPLPLLLHAAVPGKGKPVQVFPAAANAVEAQAPRSTSLPLRPVMTFGPAPVAAKNEVKAEVKSAGKNEVKNEVKNEAKSEPKPEPKRPPVTAPVRPDPRLSGAKLRGVPPEAKEDSKPIQKIAVPEPVKEVAPALKQVAKAEPPSIAKPPIKVDAKQEKKPEVKEPVRLKEDPKAAPVYPAPLASTYPGPNDLGLPKLNLQASNGFLGQLPAVAKIGIAIVLLAAVGGLIAFSSNSGGATPTPGAGTIVAGSALPAGEAGWITDWGATPGVRSTRQISILRSSQTLTDYRIDMTGQIESKAIGWVFRAADPKNFYVTKLEIVKPGLEPTVALVRFAIINGEEQAHAQLPLPMKARLDTMYKIRFDALGNHFTTYVQDQKIDDWTDDHIKTGGVGFYRERGEDATLKGGMNVVPLMVKK